MALRVAACPRCKNALVFGEVICRNCGQTFQYGANPPPTPSIAQIVEALVAAGHPVPPGMPQPAPPPAQQSSFTAPPPASQRASSFASPPTSQASQGRANPFGGGELDHGRFEDVGDVDSPDMPGFMDSGIFKMFTPDRVDASPIFGLDSGRFEEVGAVAPAFTPGLELSPKDTVGEVFAQPVSGLFHSDIFRTEADVAPSQFEGFEPSPSSNAPARAAPVTDAAKKAAAQKKRDDALGTIVCRCGERHRLPRCPACGTSHPDA